LPINSFHQGVVSFHRQMQTWKLINYLK
jgi:hypothetical protein